MQFLSKNILLTSIRENEETLNAKKRRLSEFQKEYSWVTMT